MKPMRILHSLLSAVPLLLALPVAAEPLERRICVFDVAGSAGPTMQAMQDWRAEALDWGLDARLVPFTNEGIAAEELQSGRCDAALMTGIRTRGFNRYTGTVDSLGGIPDDDHLRTVLRVIAHPSQAEHMRSGSYEVMGIAPAGAAYIFVNDRRINTLPRAAGKRVAVLEFDPTQAKMVAQVGATPVTSDLTNFSSRFNNGVVDVIAAPLAAYNALELYRGLSPDGAIIDYPLAQISMQLVGRADRIPADIAQRSREYFFEHFDDILEVLNREAEHVNPDWFEPIPEEDMQEYEVLLQDSRVQLREEGYYDPEMLTLQRRVRCRLDSGRSECVDPVE